MWYRRFRKPSISVNNTINWFELKDMNDIDNQPIFILDEDPQMCAQYYTFEHIKKYLNYIGWTILDFRATDAVRKRVRVEERPKIKYMLYSQRTAHWFFMLYLTMRDIYKKVEGKPFKVCSDFKDEWLEDFSRIKEPKSNTVKRTAQGPRLPSAESMYRKYEEYYSGFISFWNIKNPIQRHRLYYMLMGYSMSEFALGAPGWYSTLKPTIWNSYSDLTRLYYRIDTNIAGIYSYYYSVDNKHWTEIQNVPVEMRNLIDGIIFAREEL